MKVGDIVRVRSWSIASDGIEMSKLCRDETVCLIIDAKRDGRWVCARIDGKGVRDISTNRLEVISESR